VDANLTIVVDKICKDYVTIPENIVIPKGTKKENAIPVVATFNPEKQLMCGISFLLAPKGKGTVKLRHGVRVPVTFKPVKGKEKEDVHFKITKDLLIMIGGIALIPIAGYLVFKILLEYYYII